MSRHVLGAVLVTFGLAVASIMRVQLPHTSWGDAAFTLAIWLGFFPLVSSMNWSVWRYWTVLAVGMPVVMVLTRLGDSVPYRAEQTAAVTGIAIAGLLVRWYRRRRRVQG